MRMDIFEGLTQDAKRKAVNEFMMVYGVDEVTEECSDNLYTAMKNFPCGLYENGYICPSDDLNTLQDLLDDAAREPDQVNMAILKGAMASASKLEFPDEGDPKGFEDLIRRCDVYMVKFDDVGYAVYVDK